MSTRGYTRLRQHSRESSRDVEARNDESRGVDTVTHLDARTAHEIEREADAHAGAQKAEAAAKVYGRYSQWILFTSLGLASYIYSLDASTTPAYLAFATSTFGGHSFISSIQVVQSLIIAIGKPVIAKVSDVTSRASAFLGVLIFYVLGYLTIALAQNVGMIADGIVLYAVGFTGLQLLTQILIADITSLQWRAFVSSLVSMPFLINGFIGPNVSSAVLESIGWRWGYGMFAIFVPATLLPLIITLFWAERKAQRLSLTPASDGPTAPKPLSHSKSTISLADKARHVAEQLDIVGLVLLGAAVALILLPLTLSDEVREAWPRGLIPTLLVLGGMFLAIFGVWDFKCASRPVIAPRFVRNRSVVCASIIGFFDFMSYFLTLTYLYTFVLVVKPWSLLNATYFMQIQTVALTVFAFVGGATMLYFRRYKHILVVGLCIRLLGVGLMIHSRGANASTAELVWTQILQGVGGGFAASAAQVGAQASVPHIDVAMVIATVLLVTEIGGALGSATAGAIWAKQMPDNLERYLPSLSPEERAELFGNMESVLKIPRGDPVREGVILAYDDTMKTMVILATVLSVIPLLAALIMPNWYLGDRQSAVDEPDLAGEVEVHDESEEEEVEGEALN